MTLHLPVEEHEGHDGVEKVDGAVEDAHGTDGQSDLTLRGDVQEFILPLVAVPVMQCSAAHSDEHEHAHEAHDHVLKRTVSKISHLRRGFGMYRNGQNDVLTDRDTFWPFPPKQPAIMETMV